MNGDSRKDDERVQLRFMRRSRNSPGKRKSGRRTVLGGMGENLMKKLLIGVAALSLLGAGTASAQDHHGGGGGRGGGGGGGQAQHQGGGGGGGQHYNGG